MQHIYIAKKNVYEKTRGVREVHSRKTRHHEITPEFTGQS